MKPGKTAIVYGLAATAGSTFLAQLWAACPDLSAQLPQLVLTGLLAGWGKWMHSNRGPGK